MRLLRLQRQSFIFRFLKAGISGIVISCGMQRVHSTDEYILIQELMKGAALVAQLIRAE